MVINMDNAKEDKSAKCLSRRWESRPGERRF